MAFFQPKAVDKLAAVNEPTLESRQHLITLPLNTTPLSIPTATRCQTACSLFLEPTSLSVSIPSISAPIPSNLVAVTCAPISASEDASAPTCIIPSLDEMSSILPVLLPSYPSSTVLTETVLIPSCDHLNPDYCPSNLNDSAAPAAEPYTLSEILPQQLASVSTGIHVDPISPPLLKAAASLSLSSTTMENDHSYGLCSELSQLLNGQAQENQLLHETQNRHLFSSHLKDASGSLIYSQKSSPLLLHPNMHRSYFNDVVDFKKPQLNIYKNSSIENVLLSKLDDLHANEIRLPNFDQLESIASISGNAANLAELTMPVLSDFAPIAQSFTIRPWKNSTICKLSVNLIETYEKIKTPGGDFKRKRQISIDDSNSKRNKTIAENNSFDDENDDYIIKEGEIWMNRFHILSQLGKGSFGLVVYAFDMQYTEHVAIKIIKNRRAFTNQAQIEIKLLQLISSKDSTDSNCLVKMKGHFMYQNHLCIVYPLLALNLYELLKRRAFSGFPLLLVRKFSKQILHGLRFLARPDIQIIHCDLKPENIMIVESRKANLKIIDFGSSCFANEKAHTYIQSRFYRSPEVIMGHSYTHAIDMWSVGCILVELLTGNPIFPGTDEHDQMCRICDIIGMPPTSFIDTSPPKRVSRMFASVRSGVYRLLPSKKFRASNKTLRGIITAGFHAALLVNDGGLELADSNSQAQFIDLVERILRIDPKERLTPEQALLHPFFQSIPRHL
ncbi:hypothetical protein O5D80_001083 [Batrachochytrium dendrobatidis]|nr:hypothetical protein O5D80_001083 [Batrachochytrium dendrobatidis]